MSNGLRGAILWEEAGEGKALLLSNEDLAVIQTKFGDDWFDRAVERCDVLNVAFIALVLELAGRGGPNGALKIPIKLADLDHLPFIDISKKTLDVLFKSIHGKTFDEYIKDMIGREQRGKENPLLSLGSGYQSLEKTLSRPDSNQANFGNAAHTRQSSTSKRGRRRR